MAGRLVSAMSRGARVMVAGAGALGLSTAFALAQAGLSVTVCDPAQQPQASAVAAGMLTPGLEAALGPTAAGPHDLRRAARNLVDLAPELGSLIPIKGQILRFSGLRGGSVSLRGEGVYAVPGSDGLAVGATMEPGVADTKIDPVALQPLVQAAGRLLPGL